MAAVTNKVLGPLELAFPAKPCQLMSSLLRSRRHQMNSRIALFLFAVSIATVSLLMGAAWAETPEAGDEIIFGCQGEGCGCTGDKKTSKPFKLYKQMNEKSEVIGDYKEPVTASAGDSFSLVKDPGQYKVTAMHEPVGGLKVGSVISRLFHHGEGSFQGTFNGRKVEFQDAVEVTLKTIKPTKLETWYQITVQGQPGYSKIFPFKACFD